MKKSLSILLLLVVTGFLLGGGGTYLVHRITSISSEGTTKETPRESESSKLKKESSRNVETEAAQVPLSSNDLQDPALQEDLFQRKLVVYSYVSGLSERKIADELKRSFSHTGELPSQVLLELQTALIERLTTLNPTLAMTYVTEQGELSRHTVLSEELVTQQYGGLTTTRFVNTKQMPFVRSVFKEWALRDRKSAVNNARSLHADYKSEALAGILVTLEGEPLSTYTNVAKELGDEDVGIDFFVKSFSSKRIDDAGAVWQKIVPLIKPDGYDHRSVLENVARQWYEQDGISVIDQLRSSALNEIAKRDLVHEILRLATEKNPHQAFQHALQIPTQGGYSMPLVAVVSKWANSDPQAAYQAIAGIQQSGQRERLQQHVISIWAVKEPYYFLENSDSFPPQFRMLGSSSALASIARTSPLEAAELALNQQGSNFGGFSSLSILQHWVDQDAEAAIQWVVNGPVSEDKRYSWMSALVTSLVHTDPRRAFDVALNQPIGENNDGAYTPALEAQVISQMVTQDFDLAVELLPKVREGNNRPQAYTSVGIQYLNLGQFSKALDLGGKLTDNEQAQYFQSLAYSWAAIDPDGLVESLKHIPTEEIRSKVAANLSNQWTRESFSEEQIEVIKQYLSDSDRQALEDQ